MVNFILVKFECVQKFKTVHLWYQCHILNRNAAKCAEMDPFRNT